MELLKLLNSNELVAQIITFLILLFLMKRFMWKPFLKTLDDRRERIASELKSIDDAKSQADKIRADYEKRISSIESEARAMLQTAAEEARIQAEKIRQAAREESERIILKAGDSIKAEVAKAEEALKDRIVNLTVDIAAKVIEEKLTVEDDRAIVESFLKEMEKR